MAKILPRAVRCTQGAGRPGLSATKIHRRDSYGDACAGFVYAGERAWQKKGIDVVHIRLDAAWKAPGNHIVAALRTEAKRRIGWEREGDGLMQTEFPRYRWSAEIWGIFTASR